MTLKEQEEAIRRSTEAERRELLKVAKAESLRLKREHGFEGEACCPSSLCSGSCSTPNVCQAAKCSHSE
jgi:hypothetical protein